jgi:PAS domain S-box-containing protein
MVFQDMIPVAEVFLLCSILSLTVGILLYGENPKHVVNRLGLLLAGVLFCWGFTQFEYMKANEIQTALFWMRLHAFWYLLPAVALDFVIFYTNLRVRRLFRCLFVYGPAVVLSLFEIVVFSYRPMEMPWGWDYAYSGYFGYVELLWTTISTVVALSILFRRYWSAESQNERIGVGYIFSGFSLPIIMGISTTFLQVLASIYLPDLTAPSAAVGFLLVAYAVSRYGSYIVTANAAADDILSTIADALFLVNCTGEVIVSNKAASRLLGYETSELIGRHLSTLACDSVSIEGLLGDSSTISESYFKTKQGRTIPVSLSKSAILTKVGDLLGYVMICRDITERKQAEQALSESERRFRTVFDSVRTGIMIIDPRTHVIVDANPVAIEMAGAPKEQIVGSTCHKHVCPTEEGHCPITDLGQTVDNAERVFLRANGKTAPVMKSVRRIVLGGREHLLESFIDITERKQMEQELAKAQRMAAIGELAAMVGHDLRNPLQGISTAAYYLTEVERSKLNKQGKEMLQVIEEAIGRSDKIIRDLLEYSREIHLELTETDVRSITKDALARLRIPSVVRLVNSTENEPKLRLDTERMRRVFLNLLQNAIDAMPDGGTLTITSKISSPNLEIAFKDTGVGMTPETMRKLWSPLYTTKAKGMGLGLAICKRIVEAHGGSLLVESTLGKGSTFTVRLPTG